MAAEPKPKAAWTITGLLFFYMLINMLINFADKAVLGLAAVPIMQDLALTPKQFELVGSSFFFLFSLSAILVGFVANRVAARLVILALALSWALVQFPMAGAVGLATLLACRILLGAGEGPAFSVAVHALYKWFPDAKRTLPTAILAQGATFGVILALPALKWIIVHHSWHWAFFALGIVGLLWVLLWLLLGREGPLVGSAQPAGGGAILERISYRRLLFAPTFIGCALAGLRRLLGAVGRPHLVHVLYRQGPRLLAGKRGRDLDLAVGDGRRRGSDDRLAVTVADGARRLLASGARRARFRPFGCRRVDCADAALRGQPRREDRSARDRRRPHRIDLRRLSGDHRRVHAGVSARRRHCNLRGYPNARRCSCPDRKRQRGRERCHLAARVHRRLQDHRIGPGFWWPRRSASPQAGHRCGTAFAPPGEDRGIVEIYCRSYLTTRRTRPHSPG